ncbi:hypothetical protein C0991_001130, partial [Blastosporella zonata]
KPSSTLYHLLCLHLLPLALVLLRHRPRHFSTHGMVDGYEIAIGFPPTYSRVADGSRVLSPR